MSAGTGGPHPRRGAWRRLPKPVTIEVMRLSRCLAHSVPRVSVVGPIAASLLAAAVALAPAPAHADTLKLFAEAHGGAMFGRGLAGDLVSGSTATTAPAAFFEGAPAGTYGALVGAQFLFLAAEIQHHQYTNGDQLATWTQLGAGMRFEIPVGDASSADRRAGKGSYFEVGLGLFFGLGTGRQVTPPLSNDEITDKGFQLQGRLGFGKHLTKLLDLGVTVPVSAGYFFKNGGGAVANDTSTHYQSVQGEVLLVVRANIGLL